MNNNIAALAGISEKKSRGIIGLMSGTSLDGLDIAFCEISGNGATTGLTLKQFITKNYEEDFKNQIRGIFSKPLVSLQQLCLLHEYIGIRHADFINECIADWNLNRNDIDLIASHGQTIYHAPFSFHQNEKFSNATLQIGDADHIAVNTGIITVSDFRQKHIAAGGEGAPLALYGDCLLFGNANENRLLLNIGGIANFTWLPANKNERIICTDTGPGNGMMDAFIQHHFPGKHFDENAQLAKQGIVNPDLLKALKEDAFFTLTLPKTTGPELFNLEFINNAKRKTGAETLSIADTMRTLNKFTTDTIVDAIKICVGGQKHVKVFCSGGGIHNPLLMEQLKLELKDFEFQTTAVAGINPDAKEAVLFALLANECVCGDPSYFYNAGKKMPYITMGKISFPW